jgi:hypothetical protein
MISHANHHAFTSQPAIQTLNMNLKTFCMSAGSLSAIGREGMFTRPKYGLQEFLISPVQLGIPYSRPRYFALMQRTPDKGGSPFPLQARIFFPPPVFELEPSLCQ